MTEKRYKIELDRGYILSDVDPAEWWQEIDAKCPSCGHNLKELDHDPCPLFKMWGAIRKYTIMCPGPCRVKGHEEDPLMVCVRWHEGDVKTEAVEKFTSTVSRLMEEDKIVRLEEEE